MDNTTIKVLEKLQFKKYQIIGSLVDKNLLINNDVDSQEFIKTNKSYNYIANQLSKKIQNVSKMKNVYFTDFKCGEWKGHSIHWSLDDIKNKYRQIEDDYYSLDVVLHQISTIKVDFVIITKNDIFEISYNYYFDFPKNSTYNFFENNLIKVYKMKMFDEIDNQNYYKAYKYFYKLNPKLYKPINNISQMLKTNSRYNALMLIKDRITKNQYKSIYKKFNLRSFDKQINNYFKKIMIK